MVFTMVNEWITTIYYGDPFPVIMIMLSGFSYARNRPSSTVQSFESLSRLALGTSLGTSPVI